MKSSSNCPCVVFEVTALSKLNIFGPVICKLRDEYHIPSKVIVSSEVHNFHTDPALLKQYDIDYVQLMPIKIGSNYFDWLLYNVWLKRNAGRILQSLNAAVLVEPSDRTYPHHYFIDSARLRGIPTVLVQESLRKDELFSMASKDKIKRKLQKILFGIDSRLKKFGKGGCDYITAWGQTSYNYYVRVGVPTQRIYITGNPAFDEITCRNWGVDSETARVSLGITPNDHVILFLTSPLSKLGILTPKEQERHICSVFSAFDSYYKRKETNVSLKLIVKLHSLEQVDYYEELIKEYSCRQFVRVARDTPLYPLLFISDASIMFSTSAGLEAALFNKPVAIIDVGKELDNWCFIKEDVAIRIGNTDDLVKYISLVTSEKHRDSIGKACGTNAIKYVSHLGKATENVAELIARIIDGKQ